MEEPQLLIRTRAAAYDEIYSRWHPKCVTREWYEARNQYFLDTDSPELGNINGDEIMFALQLIGVDQLQGRTVLDYCCGTGLSAIYLALRGGRVYACDISRQAIETARQSAKLSGVADRVCFAVMDGQHLAYPDQFFDAAYCQSALHIIADYPQCSEELARVLKRNGRVVFCQEALGHNPLLEPLRWYRRRKYKDCGGRTLTCGDLADFGRGFAWTEIHHFNLLTQVKVVLGDRARRPWPKAVLRRSLAWDKFILDRIPRMRRYCGKVVVEYSDPRSQAQGRIRRS